MTLRRCFVFLSAVVLRASAAIAVGETAIKLSLPPTKQPTFALFTAEIIKPIFTAETLPPVTAPPTLVGEVLPKDPQIYIKLPPRTSARVVPLHTPALVSRAAIRELRAAPRPSHSLVALARTRVPALALTSRSRSRSRTHSNDYALRYSADEPAVDPNAPAELPMCIACDHFISTTYQTVCSDECAKEWDNLYWSPTGGSNAKSYYNDRTNDRKQRLETIRASHCADPSPLDVTGEWSGTFTRTTTSPEAPLGTSVQYAGVWTIGASPPNLPMAVEVGKTTYSSTSPPGQECTGQLSYAGQAGGVHTFTETILTGRNCNDAVYHVSMSAAGELTATYVGPIKSLPVPLTISAMTRVPYHIDCSSCGWCEASPVTMSVVQEHARSNETGGTVSPVFTATSHDWSTVDAQYAATATKSARRRALDTAATTKDGTYVGKIMYATEMEAVMVTAVDDVSTVAPEPGTDFFTCYPKEPLSEKMKVCQVGMDWEAPANQVRTLFCPLFRIPVSSRGCSRILTPSRALATILFKRAAVRAPC